STGDVYLAKRYELPKLFMITNYNHGRKFSSAVTKFTGMNAVAAIGSAKYCQCAHVLAEPIKIISAFTCASLNIYAL
ncbi:hypothetical protein ACJX0J_035371, partial [Zea mays]